MQTLFLLCKWDLGQISLKLCVNNKQRIPCHLGYAVPSITNLQICLLVIKSLKKIHVEMKYFFNALSNSS
jgi:hypothetical protein